MDANAFNAMVGNVDLESDNQAGLAQEVLEAMLLGAPTTTPDIPTRTRDPDLTQGNMKKKKIKYELFSISCCVLTIFKLAVRLPDELSFFENFF